MSRHFKKVVVLMPTRMEMIVKIESYQIFENVTDEEKLIEDAED
jgi:hypothetical protein